MLKKIDDNLVESTVNEKYLFKNIFRVPSVGMLACPADIPAEIYGMQLCFAINNNIPFLDWGKPGFKMRSAIVDLTHSDYNLLKIRKFLAYEYLPDILRKNNLPQEIDIPEIWSLDLATEAGKFREKAHDCFIEYMSKIISDNGFRFIYLHGLSGYYDESFYDCISRLKKISIDSEMSVIVNHVVATCIYDTQNKANILRAPLSHIMIHKSHLEASALMDWSWFVTPVTADFIASVHKKRPEDGASNANLYANKIIYPVRYVERQSEDEEKNCPVKTIFYTCKYKGPVMIPLKLTSMTN